MTWRRTLPFPRRVGALPFAAPDGELAKKLLIPIGGAKGSRTPDLLNAIQALSQLSYGPAIEAAHIPPGP